MVLFTSNESTPTNQSGDGVIFVTKDTSVWLASAKIEASLKPPPLDIAGAVKSNAPLVGSFSRPFVWPVSANIFIPFEATFPMLNKLNEASCVWPESNWIKFVEVGHLKVIGGHPFAFYFGVNWKKKFVYKTLSLRQLYVWYSVKPFREKNKINFSTAPFTRFSIMLHDNV